MIIAVYPLNASCLTSSSSGMWERIETTSIYVNLYWIMMPSLISNPFMTDVSCLKHLPSQKAILKHKHQKQMANYMLLHHFLVISQKKIIISHFIIRVEHYSNHDWSSFYIIYIYIYIYIMCVCVCEQDNNCAIPLSSAWPYCCWSSKHFPYFIAINMSCCLSSLTTQS